MISLRFWVMARNLWMPRIKIIEHTGTEHWIEGAVGTSVMGAVIAQRVPGMIGECGGNLSCATCHAYIDEQWLPLLPPPTKHEALMIECAIDVRPNSRLTCQITINDSLDGIVMRLPESQL
jgi:2Fe-2S ferredoxin